VDWTPWFAAQETPLLEASALLVLATIEGELMEPESMEGCFAAEPSLQGKWPAELARRESGRSVTSSPWAARSGQS
jgi:hypothetical protein